MKQYKIGTNLKTINSIPLRTKRFVSYPELELPLSEGSVFALLSEKPLTVQKEHLLRVMRSYVLNQHVGRKKTNKKEKPSLQFFRNPILLFQIESKLNRINLQVIIQNQRFVLQKGIAQGANLSSILCDLYYANMTDEKFSRYRDQGFLYRYVDDFLFVTEDKTLAEE